VFSSALLGCGSKAPVAPPVPTAPQPITGDYEQWTWVGFDDTRCADGNPTGLAINLTDRSPNALIFLMGGGACWNYASCYQSTTAAYIDPGFEASDMPFLTIEMDAVGVTNRDSTTNPFRDYSFVAVPYCTGDAFTGDNTMVYDGHPTVHAGHANILAYLERLVPTFPKATRIVLLGVSAGGIGAGFNWWHVQQAFGSVRVDLVDDSGPALPAPYLAPSLVQTWRDAWGMDAGLPPDCTECKTALDALITYTANAVPGRGALLDFTQDSVLPGFMNISTAQFGMGLDALAQQRLEALSRVRYFFADQAGHVLLPHPDLSQNGVNVWDWINQMESDDPSWQSVHP
jgi:hypothetical protein